MQRDAIVAEAGVLNEGVVVIEVDSESLASEEGCTDNIAGCLFHNFNGERQVNCTAGGCWSMESSNSTAPRSRVCRQTAKGCGGWL